MQAAADGGVTMGRDGTGYFVFPTLHPAIDGLFALGKLLEMLARQQTVVGCRRRAAGSFTWPRARWTAMWETKGRIMRCLIQQFTKLRVETLDGIKIYLSDTEWVLIKPDNDTATFHLVAEGDRRRPRRRSSPTTGASCTGMCRCPAPHGQHQNLHRPSDTGSKDHPAGSTGWHYGVGGTILFNFS